MFFTGQGDKGTTKTLSTPERIPKDHVIIEALGAVDELNTWLGLCRAKFHDENLPLTSWPKLGLALKDNQENLFIIQAELAGAKLAITQEKLKTLEAAIKNLEEILPPINSFIIPGESEASALMDIARTMARKAERTVISAQKYLISNEFSLAYLNRLSSWLYGLARFLNKEKNITEQAPAYK
jgi:cob(I)alamin adenosyltransferase